MPIPSSQDKRALVTKIRLVEIVTNKHAILKSQTVCFFININFLQTSDVFESFWGSWTSGSGRYCGQSKEKPNKGSSPASM